jgi:hypothetical protein
MLTKTCNIALDGARRAKYVNKKTEYDVLDGAR